jgi:hypothetical protein
LKEAKLVGKLAVVVCRVVITSNDGQRRRLDRADE